MRLSILDNGHRLRARLFFAVTGRDAPDVVRMLLYRPDFFARPLLAITVPAMRGPSYWTAGEREYLAMRTAQLYQCPFCVDSHTELTRIAGQGEIDPDDPETDLAEPWRSYTALVRYASHRITEDDITRLTDAGHREDEVFELTVAAAVGAALRTYDAGQRALENNPA